MCFLITLALLLTFAHSKTTPKKAALSRPDPLNYITIDTIMSDTVNDTVRDHAFLSSHILRGDPDSCGYASEDCAYTYNLPDCCDEYDDTLDVWIEYCCDKNIWRYYLYASLSVLFLILLLLRVLARYHPECFARFLGVCWACVTCRWIRRNFVDSYENV